MRRAANVVVPMVSQGKGKGKEEGSAAERMADGNLVADLVMKRWGMEMGRFVCVGEVDK